MFGVSVTYQHVTCLVAEVEKEQEVTVSLNDDASIPWTCGGGGGGRRADGKVSENYLYLGNPIGKILSKLTDQGWIQWASLAFHREDIHHVCNDKTI